MCVGSISHLAKHFFSYFLLEHQHEKIAQSAHRIIHPATKREVRWRTLDEVAIMMQRKKNSDNGFVSHSALNIEDDDGGSAKQKPSNLLFAPRLHAVFAPSSTSSKSSFSKSKPGFFLPGVPMALKLILLSFVGFAVLVVFTAKGKHAHWRYGSHWRYASPHMPKPLGVGEITRMKDKGATREKSSQLSKKDYDQNYDDGASSLDATQRMLAQPSRFVESEKKLKQQLLKLFEKQNGEHTKKPKNPNDSMLGVKISNRYLGENLLPYPETKGGEKEWEKKMERRKNELRKEDEQEWNELIQKYYEVMENIDEENDHSDHTWSFNVGGSEHRVQQRIDSDKGEVNPDGQMAVRPPKGTERWPSPSEKAGTDTTILLQPAFGSHRPSSDAILVFAEGYDLSIYLAFMESLIKTGYSGDVVLSISSEEKLKPNVKEYLQSKNAETGGVNVVAYEVNWSCFKKSGEEASSSGEGINHCKMNNAFGDAAGNSISDPREPRPVATARYELYWMWSLHYNKESWLMLIDARDVWFQLHPFQDLLARGKVSGELHFFGENADAVKIGSSRFNRSWLITAYGEKNVSSYFEKPVICSGSTIGNQDAIETYLRAMVAEFDTTLCKSKGCDQGFHNYLYYSGKLGADDTSKVEGISKVIVHEQGKGIINNVAALREKPLKEWGLYDAEKQRVLNWDGTTSAVAHQYDRDKEVNIMVKGKKRQFEQQWKALKK
mmetsp:Transcript_45668/g.97070  ORF Transcript_45668/g.97070 Transcript_45668/m.97070 type:complete len:721 (-) Transcript_45668:21-2183(-)